MRVLLNLNSGNDQVMAKTAVFHFARHGTILLLSRIGRAGALPRNCTPSYAGRDSARPVVAFHRQGRSRADRRYFDLKKTTGNELADLVTACQVSSLPGMLSESFTGDLKPKDRRKRHCMTDTEP